MLSCILLLENVILPRLSICFSHEEGYQQILIRSFFVLALHQTQEEVGKDVFILWHFPVPREVVNVNDIKSIAGPMLSDNI